MSLVEIYYRLPECIRPVAKRLFEMQRWSQFYIQLPLLRVLDRFKLNNLDKIYSEDYFEQRMKPPHDTVANEFTSELIARYQPSSVADIGCAIGHYLHKFEEKSIDTFGIEGAEKAVEHALTDSVHHADLRDHIKIEKEHDIVLCIEVAEHIHPIYADNVVETITSAGKEGGKIIFTAAPPGQYGTHHINLKPKKYWIEKFESNSASYMSEETNSLIDVLERRIPNKTWPLQNIMVYEVH